MTHDDIVKRLRERLLLPDVLPGDVPRGDFDLNPHLGNTSERHATLKAAAVLIPIVLRRPDPQVLFTRRADHLSRHAGQVSFPGGRVEANDASVIDAALRETEEEVGLSRAHVEILGALDAYETGTGFRIQPIVGLVQEGFDLRVDPEEVAEVFEVPLAFFADLGNHLTEQREHKGVRYNMFAAPFGRYHIWGLTAGILRTLAETLQDDETALTP